jgi:hypothetical protein
MLQPYEQLFLNRFGAIFRALTRRGINRRAALSSREYPAAWATKSFSLSRKRERAYCLVHLRATASCTHIKRTTPIHPLIHSHIHRTPSQPQITSSSHLVSLHIGLRALWSILRISVSFSSPSGQSVRAPANHHRISRQHHLLRETPGSWHVKPTPRDQPNATSHLTSSHLVRSEADLTYHP